MNDNINKFSTTELDALPLTIAYVPMQKFTKLYDNDKALNQGTLFQEIDKPFYGGLKNR